MAMLHKTVVPQLVDVEILTASGFEAFGSVIENPSNGKQSNTYGKPMLANQGTALKYSNVSSLVHRYMDSTRQTASKPAFSLFVCSPRQLDTLESHETVPSQRLTQLQRRLKVSVMERHPFTTQTFIPLGLSSGDKDTAYLVVVAPTVAGSTKDAGMPDVLKIRAFLARGSQAVTYGLGTWHAPMIVIGKEEITFVVLQNVNGIPEDDCEEIEFLDDGLDGVVLSISPT